MLNMQIKATFFKEILILILQEKLPYPQKLVKRLFSSGQLPNVQILGRLKHFVKKWELLTKDQSILEIVKGYQIPFLSQPLRQQLSREIHLNLKQKSVVTEEIGNPLKKAAKEKAHMKKVSAKSQFESNLSIGKKKDGGGGNRPAINLKNLNQYTSHRPFQNGERTIIERYPHAGQLHVQIGSKILIFLHPTSGGAEEFVRFYWKKDLYQFLCLCFGLAPAPYVFTKVLKIPIVFLRRIDTLITVYLYDMLLIGGTAENVQMHRDAVILLLQELGFVINLKKLVMTLSQEMKFLGMVINSK